MNLPKIVELILEQRYLNKLNGIKNPMRDINLSEQFATVGRFLAPAIEKGISRFGGEELATALERGLGLAAEEEVGSAVAASAERGAAAATRALSRTAAETTARELETKASRAAMKHIESGLKADALVDAIAKEIGAGSDDRMLQAAIDAAQRGEATIKSATPKGKVVEPGTAPKEPAQAPPKEAPQEKPSQFPAWFEPTQVPKEPLPGSTPVTLPPREYRPPQIPRPKTTEPAVPPTAPEVLPREVPVVQPETKPPSTPREVKPLEAPKEKPRQTPPEFEPVEAPPEFEEKPKVETKPKTETETQTETGKKPILRPTTDTGIDIAEPEFETAKEIKTGTETGTETETKTQLQRKTTKRTATGTETSPIEEVEPRVPPEVPPQTPPPSPPVPPPFIPFSPKTPVFTEYGVSGKMTGAEVGLAAQQLGKYSTLYRQR
jgi:hypothetical protein